MTGSLSFDTDSFHLRLANSAEDIRASQKLRYEVFVQELGGTGTGVDHARRIEADAFDDVADHILLFDKRQECLAGVYRVLRPEHVGQGFYSAGEYDLTPLLSCGRKLLELGRSCVHPAYRGGPAMFHLWSGIARYVAEFECEILFGVASFHGADPKAHAAQLSLLHHRHRAAADLCPRAEPYQRMDLLPEDQFDRRAAMVAMPSLIKSYLRLGGQVGDGAFVDRDFDCVDVLMIMDTARLNQSLARRLTEATA